MEDNLRRKNRVSLFDFKCCSEDETLRMRTVRLTRTNINKEPKSYYRQRHVEKKSHGSNSKIDFENEKKRPNNQYQMDKTGEFRQTDPQSAEHGDNQSLKSNKIEDCDQSEHKNESQQEDNSKKDYRTENIDSTNVTNDYMKEKVNRNKNYHANLPYNTKTSDGIDENSTSVKKAYIECKQRRTISSVKSMKSKKESNGKTIVKIEDINLVNNQVNHTADIIQCTCCSSGDILRIRTVQKQKLGGKMAADSGGILSKSYDESLKKPIHRESLNGKDRRVSKVKTTPFPIKLLSCVCIECICPGNKVSDVKTAYKSNTTPEIPMNGKNTNKFKPRDSAPVREEKYTAGTVWDTRNTKPMEKTVIVSDVNDCCCSFICLPTKTSKQNQKVDSYSANNRERVAEIERIHENTNVRNRLNTKPRKKKRRKKTKKRLEYDIPEPYLELGYEKVIVLGEGKGETTKHEDSITYENTYTNSKSGKQNGQIQKVVLFTNRTPDEHRLKEQYDNVYDNYLHAKYTSSDDRRFEEPKPTTCGIPFENKDSIINGVFHGSQAKHLKKTSQGTNFRSKAAYVPTDSCRTSSNADVSRSLERSHSLALQEKRLDCKTPCVKAVETKMKVSTKTDTSKTKCNVWMMKSPTSECLHKENDSCHVDPSTQSGRKNCSKIKHASDSEWSIKPLKNKSQASLNSTTIDKANFVHIIKKKTVYDHENNINYTEVYDNANCRKEIKVKWTNFEMTKNENYSKKKLHSSSKTMHQQQNSKKKTRVEDKSLETVDIHDIGVILKPPHHSYKPPPSKVNKIMSLK